MELLAAPNKDTLKRPPLELVVCQVRHEPVAGIGDATRLRAIQQGLGQGFDRFEPVTASMAASAQPSIVGWRITNENGWIATLGAEAFSLECTTYTSWSAFRALMSSLTKLFHELYSPTLIQRVGLRYVDRLNRSDTSYPRDWAGLLHPAVLGFGMDDSLAEATLVAQTSNEMLIDGLRANVRGSIAQDNTSSGYSFLLDTDCFDERSKLFETEAIASVIESLHELNLRVFQHVILPDLYEEIHG